MAALLSLVSPGISTHTAAPPSHPAQEHGPGGKRFTFCIGKDASQPQRSRFLMAAKQVGAAARLAAALLAAAGLAAARLAAAAARDSSSLPGCWAGQQQGAHCPPCAGHTWPTWHACSGLWRPILSPCRPPTLLLTRGSAGRAGRGAPVPQQPLPRPALCAPALQFVCHPGAVAVRGAALLAACCLWLALRPPGWALRHASRHPAGAPLPPNCGPATCHATVVLPPASFLEPTIAPPQPAQPASARPSAPAPLVVHVSPLPKQAMLSPTCSTSLHWLTTCSLSRQ